MLAVALTAQCMAQAPAKPATPATTPPVALAVLNQLSEEVDKAFAAKDYLTAAAKIEELLAKMGTSGSPEDREQLHFQLGFAYLQGERFSEAETAFTTCLEKFPKSSNIGRFHLGIGLACAAQGKDKDTDATKALALAKREPALRAEACLALAKVLAEAGKRKEALAELRSLMGADVRTPAQTDAAVAVVSLLADDGSLDDLVPYMDRVVNQAGVRDVMAWFVNQVIVRADEAVSVRDYETGLAIYQSIPPRTQIMEVQSLALEAQRKTLKTIEAIAADKAKSPAQRGAAATAANALKGAIEQATTALGAITTKADLDPALLMRRGRCLFYLKRHEEALLCFSTLCSRYATAPDAKAAAYAAIIIYSEQKNYKELQQRCNAYLTAFPDAEDAEQVASLAGELLVQDGKWAEVGKFYKNLEAKFPKSENLERFVFYQAAAHFYAAEFDQSTPLLERFFKDYPRSELLETALYYVAMTQFLSNNYKETLAACAAYLTKFPDGRYAGDMQYRLSFIDYNDKEDQSDKIIRELGAFVAAHEKDLAVGSMLCLMADTYKKKANDNEKIAAYEKANGKEAAAAFVKTNEDAALAAYQKAVWTESPDDVVQYGLDTATTMLQARKDWEGIAALHGEFLQKYPKSPLAMLSATWVAKAKIRAGKPEEAAAILADSLKSSIANPASEQVEFLIDELVKVTVPRKKAAELDLDVLDKQLVEVLSKVIADNNPTANARLYYARARLAQILKRPDRSDLYLRGIARDNAANPSVLSPALLSVSGDILLKDGKLDEAEGMFARLKNGFADSPFSDAGPVGLGRVALAKKQPQQALEIFQEVMEKNPGSSSFKETTLGLLEAMIELGHYEEATKLALDTIGDKTFKGETAGRAYLLQARMFRRQAEKAAGSQAKDLRAQAHAVYQRVYITYVSIPEVCADAYWGAYETLKEMAMHSDAKATLALLRDHPKLQNTAACKRARETAK